MNYYMNDYSMNPYGPHDEMRGFGHGGERHPHGFDRGKPGPRNGQDFSPRERGPHGFDHGESVPFNGQDFSPRGHGFDHGESRPFNSQDFSLRGHGPHGFDRSESRPRDGRDCSPRGHRGPGRPGFPPRDGHGGPGGLPPRRPDPDFLKRRVEEGDLAELVDMAGRMLHRRPQGGPARGQALVLSILAGRETLSQRELQQMLGIQPGSLSELLGKLEAKGLLTREKGEDRRGNLLRITDAGRQALPQAGDIPGDDPFAVLDAGQREALAATLRALLTAWISELE